MTLQSSIPRKAPICVFIALFACVAVAEPTQGASTLMATRAKLRPQLQAQVFGEPLHLESQDSGSSMAANVYAELALPFTRVTGVLSTPSSLCGLLFLHLNVRSCQASRGAAGDVLTLAAGPKKGANAGAVYSMAYNMQVEVATVDYLRVTLAAANGPFSTSAYRILFEVTPLDGQRSFLHFSYAYNYGALAKMAVSLYQATAGRSKVGFTVVGTGSDGRPQYVQGERGSIERNVMRNFLALLAYAGVTSGTPEAQLEARLRAWYALTERYAAQLHELSLQEYLQEKQVGLAHTALSNQ